MRNCYLTCSYEKGRREEDFQIRLVLRFHSLVSSETVECKKMSLVDLCKIYVPVCFPWNV
jgi:hypothetical protein